MFFDATSRDVSLVMAAMKNNDCLLMTCKTEKPNPGKPQAMSRKAQIVQQIPYNLNSALAFSRRGACIT